VTYEFFRVTEAFGIHDAVIADGNRVVQVGAQCQAVLPQMLHVAHEAKCARAAQFVAEDARSHFIRKALAADNRGLEVDLDVEMEAAVRCDFTEAGTVLNANRLEDLEEFTRLGQFHQAGVVDSFDEVRRAAVHNRHFLAVDFYVAVIDGKPAERGQKMFDGADGIAFIIADNGAQRQVFDVMDTRLDIRDDAAAFGYEKAKPSIGLSRMQDYRCWRSTVHPRAGQFDLARNRSLARADKTIRHECRPSMPAQATAACSSATACHPLRRVETLS